VLFIIFYWGNQIREDEMGMVCSTHTGDEKLNFGWKCLKRRDRLGIDGG
jgi:hypothetical protein